MILMDPKVGEDDRNGKEETLCDEAHNTWVTVETVEIVKTIY